MRAKTPVPKRRSREDPKLGKRFPHVFRNVYRPNRSKYGKTKDTKPHLRSLRFLTKESVAKNKKLTLSKKCKKPWIFFPFFEGRNFLKYAKTNYTNLTIVLFRLKRRNPSEKISMLTISKSREPFPCFSRILQYFKIYMRVSYQNVKKPSKYETIFTIIFLSNSAIRFGNI